jgi:modulator of FtsH protease HflC
MRAIAALAAALAAVILIGASTYTVRETEQAILTQFGEPRGGVVSDPGLHWKLPFIQTVNRFDKRWLEWDGDADEMPTKEKTYIWVDSYARWRISDAMQFFKSVGDERTAQSRLDDIIDGETRNVIASFDLAEVVRLSNRPLPQNLSESDAVAASGGAEAAPEPTTLDQKITTGRDGLTKLILEKAQRAMPQYGIELVDIQFQRVNYTSSVEEKIFQRMVSERKRIAELYRSQGKGESARIRGETERELKQIESEAYRKVQEVKGEADARATALYADAHNRDPDLYRLVKSLESYEKSVDADTVLILSTESDFWQQLAKMGK